MAAAPVTLFVYDLSNGLAAVYGSALTGRPVEGIWHTALVVHGMEIFYGQGISIVEPPGTTHHGQPKKRIPCGETHLDKATILEYVDAVRDSWTAEAYHLLEYNCNSFTDTLLGFLNGNSIPADIRNQPSDIMSTPFGQQMRPMIESMFVGRRNPSAGAAVNNLVPQLGGLATPPTTSTPPSRDDVPSLASATSNLELCTSSASLRTTLASSPAVAIMFTSPTCPPCTAIKPHFEQLAKQHASPASRRIVFVVVETHAGHGADVARSPEFGGPVTATPSFAFFAHGAKVGECKGADRRELETQVGMLALAAYPPHPHDKVAVPALDKLARQLAPVTSATWPPMPALKKKLDEALGQGGASASEQDKEVLGKRVPAYLAALPAPPAPSPRASAPLPAGLLDAWLPATLAFLSSPVASPSTKFPTFDLVRLALSRDAARLATQPSLVAFFPNLLALLAAQLAEHDHDPSADRPPGERAYLLTALRTLCNGLAAPALASRILTPSEAPAPDARASATRLVLAALLDRSDPKMRREGAGAAWSVVARVYAARVEGEAAAGEAEGGDEWEAELATALLEGLTLEEDSVEVVHRLAATLGLLLYRSPYSADLVALLDVLDASTVLEAKAALVKRLSSAGEGNEAGEVRAVLKDGISPTVLILLMALLVAVGVALYFALRGGNLFRRDDCSTRHDSPDLRSLPIRWVLLRRVESPAEPNLVERLTLSKRGVSSDVEAVRQAVHGHDHDADEPSGGPSKTSNTSSSRPSGSSGGGGDDDKSTLGPSPSSSPTTGSPSGGPLVDDSLKGHNDFRATHHADDLAWNDTLAEAAQRWVENCVWEHSGGSLLGGGYGENLWMSSSTAFTKQSTSSVLDAVASWNDEEHMYDYGNPGFTHETGHFTQDIWVGTKTVGCAMGTCMGLMSSGQWAVYYVCEYFPPGNWEGQFPENVLPP
ncbi:hypothetical protein JCM8208_005463 [Rhodotorula glutinis]